MKLLNCGFHFLHAFTYIFAGIQIAVFCIKTATIVKSILRVHKKLLCIFPAIMRHMVICNVVKLILKTF